MLGPPINYPKIKYRKIIKRIKINSKTIKINSKEININYLILIIKTKKQDKKIKTKN